MEESWKITLSDGTQLKNLKLNGNNFVSKAKITEDMFKGKLSKVIYERDTDGETIKEEYTHMALVQITTVQDEYYFILRKLSEAELKEIKMKSDIEYIAMMTDIELEEV